MLLFKRYLFVNKIYFSWHSTLAERVQILYSIFLQTWYCTHCTLVGRQYSCTILMCASVHRTLSWNQLQGMFRMQSFGGMLNRNISLLYCPTSRVLCELKDGCTHLLFSCVFLLLEMESKRKKERRAGGGEGEYRYKLSITQCNLLFILWLLVFV